MKISRSGGIDRTTLTALPDVSTFFTPTVAPEAGEAGNVTVNPPLEALHRTSCPAEVLGGAEVYTVVGVSPPPEA